MGSCVEGKELLRLIRDQFARAASLLSDQPALGAMLERRDELGRSQWASRVGTTPEGRSTDDTAKHPVRVRFSTPARWRLPTLAVKNR